MEYLKLGVYAGLLLAIATAAGGLLGFLMGLVFAGVGGLLGAHRDGLIDLRTMLGSGGRGRR
ncbi:DUF2273 domain-containing protein [Corynebacterium xerosis]|uniref:DUF2273 domain-containing protein n=1 Tax=Corynebacterium xerosis TaxID=1725 RepID=A0A2N6SX16_9CORY|nr:DUF2273 domain-containing protein [Corynebacterium xerosis]PMC61610.1 DUF2273 domain-containing protein [Corynebacterium xerosis]QGS34775.1 DUF2273 domain-containing protein [Corynebacterium xerosis]